ncbi:hypothetical protein ACSFA3_02440 [Variovorax sp. RHLX14]|uniref:hypothetical protein n=1 Tax=Variovorax sp. RHLX14 TaxID=1259731 RepID=UPI003F472138
MENVLFSSLEWAIIVLAVAGAGLWALMSLNRLPQVLHTEISRRVEHSIVVEHDTGADKL